MHLNYMEHFPILLSQSIRDTYLDILSVLRILRVILLNV